MYYAKCELKRSDPFVIYKETVIGESPEVILCKSQNKHNRLYGTGAALQMELQETIEKGEMGPNDDIQERSKRLVDEFGWDKTDAMGIWCFGPDNEGPNILVNATKGVQYLNEIKNFVCSAFQRVTECGILIDESIRGMRCNLVDCQLFFDAIHRSGGQYVPAARRLFYACELTSTPSLLEPIYNCEITIPMDSIGKVYECLNARRAEIINEV